MVVRYWLFVPGALFGISLLLTLVLFWFVLLSAYSKVSCFAKREGSDNYLIRWQVASALFGVLSLLASIVIWIPGLSSLTCDISLRTSQVCYNLSLFFLYCFYECRQIVVRPAAHRRFIDFLLISLTGTYALFAPATGTLTSGKASLLSDGHSYCSSSTPGVIYSVEAAFDLVLNSSYLYCFVRALKQSKEWQQDLNFKNAKMGADYSHMIRRNKIAAFITTLATFSTAIFCAVAQHLLSKLWGEFAFTFYAVRGLAVAIWSSGMFLCTIFVWKGKRVNADSKNSNNSVPTLFGQWQAANSRRGSKTFTEGPKALGDTFSRIPGDFRIDPQAMIRHSNDQGRSEAPSAYEIRVSKGSLEVPPATFELESRYSQELPRHINLP